MATKMYLQPSELGNGPHEINSLDIEDINLEIQSQWHCIPFIDISVSLTSAAALNK
jgi:hypothetical protein